MLPELLGPGQPGFDLRFRGPDGTEQTSADVVLVSNNAYRLRSLGRSRHPGADRPRACSASRP